uniref:CD276 antigen homolog isoform X2 n=1 Tax=Scatophagus argus TaxID=75038 RepID=UPI001ED80193|nr:CD276 antigen homolog isoform X2 [Scatophagus argus]
MAPICIFLYIFAFHCITNGASFVNVQCKKESTGEHGQETLLECVVKTAQADPQIRVVTWKKEGVEEPLLVFYRGETTLLPGFSFAQPLWNDRNMNVSLLIRNTTPQDEGIYTCVVMTNVGSESSATHLTVTAKYSMPTVMSKPEKIIKNTEGVLVCESHDGYPQGQLRWFDADNHEWTRSAEMKVEKTETGLFHLSSKLTLRPRSIFSKYTCAVFNASGGKENESTFEILDASQSTGSESGKGLDSASKIVAPLVVIGSLIAGLLLALLIYKKRSQPGHQGVRTCDSEVEEGDHQDMYKICRDNQV